MVAGIAPVGRVGVDCAVLRAPAPALASPGLPLGAAATFAALAGPPICTAPLAGASAPPPPHATKAVAVMHAAIRHLNNTRPQSIMFVLLHMLTPEHQQLRIEPQAYASVSDVAYTARL
jgi:hypothetical protein